MFKNLNLKDNFDIHNKKHLAIILVEIIIFFVSIFLILLLSNKANININFDSTNTDPSSYPDSYSLGNPESFPNQFDNSDNAELTGNISIRINGKSDLVESRKEKNEKAIWLLDADSTINRSTVHCRFTTYSINGNQKSIYSESDVTIIDGMLQGGNVQATAGDYQSQLICPVEDKTFESNIVSISITEAPGSICDSNLVSVVKGSQDFETIKSQIIGKWHGCVLYSGAMPNPLEYEIEFIFNPDGSYESRNIEVVSHSDTLRTQPALYYGSDENNVNKTYELKNQLTNGDVEGDIYIYFGPESTKKASLKSVKLDTDNNKLYFEVDYYPSWSQKYYLERVIE